MIDLTPISEVGLVEGSVVSVYDPSARPTGPLVWRAGASSGVESGIDAGAVAYFGTKADVSIGRDSTNDFVANETVSGSHAVLTCVAGDAIELRDLGSHNGTWIGDAAVDGPHRLEEGETFRLGSSLLRVDTPGESDRPVGVSPMHSDDEGRILINRPPRGAIPSGPQAIVVPRARPTRTNPFFSVVSLLVPLIFAAVMIKVTGRWQYAMFALLSPLMLIGTFVTNRRKVKKERADDEEDYVEALERLTNDFARAEQVERATSVVVCARSSRDSTSSRTALQPAVGTTIRVSRCDDAAARQRRSSLATVAHEGRTKIPTKRSKRSSPST